MNPAILQYVNTPSPQNIDTDTLWLAEHHLYGSSRLGIKQYEPHQYRNVYSNTQPFVKGINVKQPWYSLGTEEMIKSGIKSLPLLSSHYLVDTFRYRRDLGTKYYELSDHLGNVLSTVLDRKSGYGSLNGEYAGFRADIASATDYYSFGMEMPGRTIDNSAYRFGFNTQEKIDEIAGKGNHNTALFWEYDTRTARRWNLDPVDQINISNYAAFQNSPIIFSDILGNKPDWVMSGEDNSIRWDPKAKNQLTTKLGEKYLGKELYLSFTSYIDGKLWDGPNVPGVNPAGDKLITNITLTGTENEKGELTGITATKSVRVGETPIGKARDYYPGPGGNVSIFADNSSYTKQGLLASYNLTFEKHASVPKVEEYGLTLMGYKIVDVAQKLNVSFNHRTNKLSITPYTNVFPSAYLLVNAIKIMQYNQPSFKKTHSAFDGSLKTNTHTWDRTYYPVKFYQR